MGRRKQLDLFEQEIEDDDFGFDFDCQTNAPALEPKHPEVKPQCTNKIRGGEVRLGVEEYFSILSQIKKLKEEKAPKNFIISEILMKGENKGKKYCKFTIEFIIQQLQDRWSCIELLPTSIVVKESRIFNINTENEKIEIQAYIGVSEINNFHCFYVKEKGIYNIKIQAKVAFISTRAQGIEIKLPKSVKNSLEFTVFNKDLEITAVPSLGSKLKVNEGNLTLNKQSQTVLICDVPPTNHLSIQWKEKLEEEEGIELKNIDEQEKQVIVNVEQLTLHSVGEGMVQSIIELNYTILHGSRGSFEILIPNQLRILSIDGEAIKRWEVLIVNEKHEEQQVFDNEIQLKKEEIIDHDFNDNFKLLKIWLDYGMENQYKLQIHTETDMESTSCDVKLQNIYCKHVNREKGFLAIEARTNVEVSEIERFSLTRIASSELPKSLIHKSINPPLLSYKFLLSSESNLLLNVKKHDDAEVLVASIESAHLCGTLSEDKILYHFIMNVRNNQTQFVRIRLPENSIVWSSLVANRAVKPAKDNQGYVMIPLQKSRTMDNKHEAFSVELVYLTNLQQKMNLNSKKGKISLSACPLVDIPINHLFVTLKLPQNYKYSEFSGDLQEIPYFTSSPPDPNCSAGMPIQQQIQQQQQNYAQFTNVKRKEQRYGSKTMASGILPIKIQMPTAGKPFYFERLLVIDESFVVSVNYKRLPQKKRSLDMPLYQRIGLILLFIWVLFYLAPYLMIF